MVIAEQPARDVPINVPFAIAGGILIALSILPFIFNNIVWFRRWSASYVHVIGGPVLGIGLFLLCVHSNVLLGVLLAAVASVADPGTRELFGARNRGFK